jgi:hypothetical protein
MAHKAFRRAMLLKELAARKAQLEETLWPIKMVMFLTFGVTFGVIWGKEKGQLLV